VIHQGALGDFILTFSALGLLKQQIGPVDVLCRSGPGRVACRLGLAERRYSIDAAAFVSLFTDAIDPPAERILRNYDTILLISFSEAVEQVLRRCLRGRVFRVSPRPPDHQRVHVAEFIVEALRAAGLVESPGAIVGPMGRSGSRNRHGVDPDRILLHPGAGSLRKRWPLRHFKTIFGRLQRRGMAPEILIGPAELDVAPRIAAGWEKAQPLVISDPDRLMDNLETAGGLIGNDSGVSHLSAWMGVPTVACFGPTDPARWRPVGPRVSVLRPSRGGSDHALGSDMSRISPERVLAAFMKLRGATFPSESGE